MTLKDAHFLKQRDLTNSQILEIKKAYDKNSERYASLWEWRKGAIEKATIDLLKPFRRLMRGGDLALVAGCGTGRDVQYLTLHGVNCLGIDFSKGMLQEAIKRGVSSPLVLMDIRDLKLIPHSFEGIYCETAMEHIPKVEINQTIDGFWKVLKPEGIALFGLRRGNGDLFFTEDIGGKRYFTTYTEKEVKGLISRLNCDVIDVKIAEHADRQRPAFINYFVRKRK